MNQDFQPYPEYKDSGLPWLGRIPKHWNQRSLWSLSKPREEKNPGNLPLLSVFLYLGVIKYEDGGGQVHAPSLDLSNYQVVKPGDFVLNNQQAWRGSVGVSRYSGIISPAYIVLELSEIINPSYANFLFRCPASVDQFVVASKGVGDIQRQIYWPYLRYVQVPLPPLAEQTAIVSFLDHADRRIKRYIRAKQKLIKLLNEQKQAIIQQAVTRGLDPNVRLKPSGVEWLGDIPEHWETRRIKSISQVKRGASPRPIDNSEYFDENGEYAWVRIADVTASDNYLEHTTQRLSALGQSLSVALEPGSLFLSIAGSVGKPIITHIRCCIHDGFVYFPRLDRNYSPFLYNVFSCGAPFARLGKLGTQLNLNTGTVGNIFIGWPQLQEQIAINQYITDTTKVIQESINLAKHEIALIQEYRTRLIAEVVTGKLDVRAAAAQLPEELSEPEPLEAEIGLEEDEDQNEAESDLSDEEGEG